MELKEGDSGSAVKEVQELLVKKGFDPGPADGIFGSKTKAAVIKFQQANKLVADGIVGAKTMEVLKGTKPSTPPIKLTDVCEYYDAAKNPHQKAAIEWLQTQIPVAVLEDFGKRWRKQ